MYLMYVMDTKKVALALEEISIVKQFPKVFPEELIGLPSKREVEFVIELEVNTAPISKAPY